MSGYGTRPTRGLLDVDANRQRLADALLGIPERVGGAFTGMAQRGLLANDEFMSGKGADQQFLPTTDSGGRLGALASFLSQNMAMGGPAGSLGAGPSMARKASALPMDEAAAFKARFDKDVYHGTGANVGAFDRRGEGGAVFVSPDPALASQYADGWQTGISKDAGQSANVMPLKLDSVGRYNGNSPVELETARQMIESAVAKSSPLIQSSVRQDALAAIGEKPTVDSVFRAIERATQAQPGEVMSSFGIRSIDSGYPEIRVLDPSALRSRFAAFDPAKRNSADLLASYGPNPLASALYAQPQE
jgi:hypothetical protein